MRNEKTRVDIRSRIEKIIENSWFDKLYKWKHIGIFLLLSLFSVQVGLLLISFMVIFEVNVFLGSLLVVLSEILCAVWFIFLCLICYKDCKEKPLPHDDRDIEKWVKNEKIDNIVIIITGIITLIGILSYFCV